MDGQMRMTEGSIAGHMIRFAVPLFFGNLFQQLYNTADSLIVGNMVGESALAAVSSTGNLIFLLIGLFQGIFLGAGVVISKYFGAKDRQNMERAIHTTFLLGIISGVFLTAFGTLMSPVILRWMDTPADVMSEAVSYVTVYFAGSLAFVMYNACTGIMQAVGDSRHPLYYLIISSCVNVVLDIVFIAVFDRGVEAAAFATVLSQLLSVVLCTAKLMRVKADYRLQIRKIRFDGKMMIQVIRIGLPTGMQNSIIGFANVIVQSNINAFGTMAVAGCGAYSKIEGFAFLPVTSFTAAITTFVGQNLGGGEYERAKRGSRFGICCSILIAEIIGVIIYTLSPVFIAAFTDDPEAITFGVDKSHICALFYCLLAASHCLSAVLRGAGKSAVPMFTMLACWCVIRVSFLMIMVPLTKSIDVVNWVYPLTWTLSTIVLTVYFFKADWVHGLE